ncbi:hypothetical protein M407DRAFT_31410 [Tulasnella calospora MUT 4182]|uniref:Protein kinase domain-containing protein n=1 Tax=Tulasnella calospora MUT 4182 TaxID=1051891 RepID=A0A0C3KBX0_9AGAM|nr:hypothetical protein M407DRAFT_31410 [Tulasnella calospora MUT 4182]
MSFFSSLPSRIATRDFNFGLAMNPDVHKEITRLLPRMAGVDRDYYPVLYRPDSIKVIPVYVRDLHSLTPASPSELSQQISLRNIALVQRRIDAVGDLDPKRILKCYGYRFGDDPFMIVDLDNKELLSHLVAQGDLNLLDGLKLLYETGKAIQYLHSRSPPVVHGAVHPRNILIARPDVAVLCDFGLANIWRLFEVDRSLYEEAKAGTPPDWLSPAERLGYTAPEYILDDKSEMLPPADIYAFASVILAVLSSRHPHADVLCWTAKGIAAIVYGVPPDPEDHPNLPNEDSLWPLLQRMWSRNPADRPAIDEVMKQLGQELKTRSEEAHLKIITNEATEGLLNESQASASSHNDFSDGTVLGSSVAGRDHSHIQPGRNVP